MSQRPLGALEDAVLEHLWVHGESDVSETHAGVGRARGIAPNTVGSALERLHRKHLLSRRKVSHAYRYSPVMDRDSFRAWRAAEAAGGVRALADEGLLAAFVDLVAQADSNALERLARLVETRRGEPGD
jgi:predicted transcriptional regulator